MENSPNFIAPHRFIDIIEQYIASYYSLNPISSKTKLNYDCFVKSIRSYLKQSRQEDIKVTEITFEFAEQLNIYLRKTVALTQSGRVIELCKRSIEYARKKKIVLVNEIIDFKTGRDKQKDVVHLEQNELQRFIYPQLLDRELEIAADIYVFQANTGMSFGDLWTYRIITDHVGYWIYNKRNKNGNQYWVPLSSEAKRVHEKYCGKIPKIHLVTYNRKLKLIAERESINKNLSSHTARKTFATLMYEKGWTIEAIADMMGITIVVLMKHYIKKSRKRLENEVVLMNQKAPRDQEAKEITLRIV